MRRFELETAKLCVFFFGKNKNHFPMRALSIQIVSPLPLSDPVFFASQCGRESALWQSLTALSVRDADDQRLSSLASAVAFAKSNNLLGVLLEAELLVNAFCSCITSFRSVLISIKGQGAFAHRRCEGFRVVGDDLGKLRNACEPLFDP
jgi:hypothetical protein